MSSTNNRFNEFSEGGSAEVSDGSLNIWGYTLKASNLNPNEPLKTNSTNQLVSSKLNISDVVNLQAELNSAIQNPNQNNLISDGVEITSGNTLKTDSIEPTTVLADIIVGGNMDLTNTYEIHNALNMSTSALTSSGVVTSQSVNTSIIEPNPVIDSQNITIQTPNINYNVVNANFNGQPLQEIEQRYTRQGANWGTIGTDSNSFFVSNFGNTNVDVTLRGTGGKQLSLVESTSRVLMENVDLDVNQNNIENVNTAKVLTIENQTVGNPITLNSSLFANNVSIEGATLLESDAVTTDTLNPSSGTDITSTASFDMNDNDITNVRSLSLTSTRYISRVEDMGTPSGDFYIIPANTTWIILGQITLQYGIAFSANASLRGVDFSATLTFDETFRDCSIKATSENFYLSHITLVSGGGRFTGDTTLVNGLLDAANYNTLAPAPFYGRNKRFKVSDCNIIRPFKIGTIIGYGTLNITNNFFNGGGGLAGQASDYYTNEGLSVTGGLSLEFNNNKMVLMAGAQQVSTAKLLYMAPRFNPVLGFNAVTITGNIFHPRGTETGVDFDADSRTELGNISGNVFIRTGGTSPLINYTNQNLYDNYNVDSIRNYNINANTGVVDSEPTLKSGFGESNIITTSSYVELEFKDNSQVLAINESSRFGIQLDVTGITTAFVSNERITDTASGNTAYVIAVDAESGGNQSVYITDMSGTFSVTPTTFTSATGTATTGGALRMRYKYVETDPRKLTLNMGITFTTDEGKDEETTFAPGDGSNPDTQCEIPVNTRNDAVGGYLNLICVRRWVTGDIINFYAKTANATTEMNILKAMTVIN